MVNLLKRNERGVALLTVLLGIALMTLIIVDFAMSAGLGFVSAANQANEIRAYYLARSGLNIGLALLAQDARADAQSGTAADTLDDIWAMPYPVMTLQGGTVSLSIVDEERKLSINGMIDTNGSPDPFAIERMKRLFIILDVNTDLIPGIVEWISPASNGSLGTAGADYYMGLRPPYQPRNGPMPTIGDLQMIKGINEAVFNRLRPFLTVMPTKNRVNVNTATPQVLAALEDELMANQKIVEEIMAARAIRPFTDPNDVKEIPGVGPWSSLLIPLLTPTSDFFTIDGMGTYAGARKTITATFHRETSGIGTLATWHED